CARRGRRAGNDRDRGQGLRAPARAHGALPRGRVRRRFSAEGEDRGGRGRRHGRAGDRGDHRLGEDRQGRGREDLRDRSRPGLPHSYRRDRRRGDLIARRVPRRAQRGGRFVTKNKNALVFCAAVAAGIAPGVVHAQALEDGSTAWLLTSTALVLFMTLPGLALFYGGLVRSRNVLSVLMQCFAICCVVSVLWFAFGYSLAFTDGGNAGMLGGLSKAWLAGLELDSVSGANPEPLSVMLQTTLPIITPAEIGCARQRLLTG